MNDVFYPPPFRIYVYIAIIAVSMAAMVPILIKGYRDNIAISEMNQTVGREISYYSSIIRTMNEDRDQRAWARQYDVPYLDWEAVEHQEFEAARMRRHRIEELLSVKPRSGEK